MSRQTKFIPGCFLLLQLSSVVAQTTPPANQDAGVATFKSSSQLVLRTVAVKDKQGKPVGGLTDKDFVLTEDGVRQIVAVCDFHDLDAAPSADASAAVAQGKAGPVSVSAKPVDRYRNRRLLTLYFDMASMPIPDQIRALRAARTFLETQMTTADMVEVLTFQGAGIRVEQDFTDDRATLLKTLQALVLGEGQGVGGSPGDASAPGSGAAFGQNDSEFNIFNTDRQLSALQTAAQMLGKLREKKTLVYFASGLKTNGLDNQAQLQATINAAIRSGISVWPIDARGLLASAPMGDATVAAPGNAGMYSGTAALAGTTSLDRSQDTLWGLAAGTGGKAMLNFNDLSLGIAHAQQSVGSYYVLGYYTTNQTLDGRFRKVRISVPAMTASLEYTPGYYAGKDFSRYSSEDKERQLEDALLLEDPVTDLSIALEVNYFKLNRAEYFVPLAVMIPGRELTLAQRKGGERMTLDFIGEVRDEFGATIANLRDRVSFTLSGTPAKELESHPIQYDSGFTLLPGTYFLKFLARDGETGKMGTFQSKFRVPDLNKPQASSLPVSSVVLSSQTVDVRDALYNSKKGAREKAHPLVARTKKLIPNIARVFPGNGQLTVYLEAYGEDASAGQIPGKLAYVTIYRGTDQVLVSPLLVATQAGGVRGRAVPIRFDIALHDLPPAEYLLQVTVADPRTLKTAFWKTPIWVAK